MKKKEVNFASCRFAEKREGYVALLLHKGPESVGQKLTPP